MYTFYGMLNLHFSPDGLFLENTASEHTTCVVPFNATCNSTHLSQSFQIVEGKTQNYCRHQRTYIGFVKITLIYNTFVNR